MSSPRSMPLVMQSAGEIDVHRFADAIPRLAEILVDAVESGASVGFELPFTHAQAEAWWRSQVTDVAAGRVVIVLASDRERRVMGTAQLRLAQTPNQRHRADVAKVLVHRDARRRGFGRILMNADQMYEALGWTRAGEIPRYATMPDGTLAPTTYFYKELK